MRDFFSKKVLFLAIACVAIAGVVVAVVFTGKEDEKPNDVPQEETESSTIVEEIDKGGDDKILDITKLSKDEFVALTWEQVRDFAENRLPNYRSIYGINEDTVMNKDEWEKLKKVMFWQLFDQTYESYLKVGNVSSDVDVETNEWGKDIIYAEPTREYIEGLSTSEFREYMKGFFAFAEASPEAATALDILTDEQVEEMRKEFIDEYFN